MAFVIIAVEKEILTDGSCHIYSPNVPGFHVVEQNSSDAYKAAMPILIDTLRDRVQEAEVGKDVRLLEAPIDVRDFIPGELRRILSYKNHPGTTGQMIIEIT